MSKGPGEKNRGTGWGRGDYCSKKRVVTYMGKKIPSGKVIKRKR